jgi:hypothetical protein
LAIVKLKPYRRLDTSGSDDEWDAADESAETEGVILTSTSPVVDFQRPRSRRSAASTKNGEDCPLLRYNRDDYDSPVTL